MKRIAYIDHSYHNKTVSTEFIPEILEKYGHKVDFFWDNSWQGGNAVNFSDVMDYDVVIMFQSFCHIKSGQYFSKLHHNVVYIPMLDQFGLWRGPINNIYQFWKPFHGVKVINFSIAAHGVTVGAGIKSHLVRFYRKPIESFKQKNGLHGIFWVRLQDELSWQKVKLLIGDTKFDSFHLHVAKDPGSTSPILPSKEDIKKYNITISTWFDRKSDFNDVLDKANVYFAPRMEEGIGQSFLEAFSRGQCVVAPNHGTMNEYIQHGVNGLLYDSTNLQPLDFSDVHNICARTYLSCRLGYDTWMKSTTGMVEYILANNSEVYKGCYDYFNNYMQESDKISFRNEIKKFLISKGKKSNTARSIYKLYKSIKG